MLNSTIEWTDATFNPWWGCVHVSPACENCYAEAIAWRFAVKHAKTHEILLPTQEVWGRNNDRLFFTRAGYWQEPLSWNRSAERRNIRQRVFCSSMCDIMERNDYRGSYIPGHVDSADFAFRPDELTLNHARQKTYKLIETTPNLDWMLLSKRPHEYRKMLPKAWLGDPRPNVWLMTTMEHQDYIGRIHELMKAPALLYGVSVEPMFSKVTLPRNFLKLGNRAWVIAGGESGRKARPETSNIEWFRDLRDQCIAAGVPFFFKQWGAHSSDLIKIGKHEAGRMLDGREWNQFPLTA